MQAINFEQNCAPHWGCAQGKTVPYCAARDLFVTKRLRAALKGTG
jgi:hypothetical protein